jgi:hypothetical protein
VVDDDGGADYVSIQAAVGEGAHVWLCAGDREGL